MKFMFFLYPAIPVSIADRERPVAQFPCDKMPRDVNAPLPAAG